MSSLVIDALDHLVINVNDVAASAEWYQRVLGMTRQDFQSKQDRPRDPVRAGNYYRFIVAIRTEI